MGTNYYGVKTIPTTNEDEWRVHIGKSSYGWLFLFHDCQYFHTYPEVIEWLESHVKTGEYVLMDEYDRHIGMDEFIEMVQKKQTNPECLANPSNFRYNVRNVDGYRFQSGDFL